MKEREQKQHDEAEKLSKISVIINMAILQTKKNDLHDEQLALHRQWDTKIPIKTALKRKADKLAALSAAIERYDASPDKPPLFVTKRAVTLANHLSIEVKCTLGGNTKQQCLEVLPDVKGAKWGLKLSAPAGKWVEVCEEVRRRSRNVGRSLETAECRSPKIRSFRSFGMRTKTR